MGTLMVAAPVLLGGAQLAILLVAWLATRRGGTATAASDDRLDRVALAVWRTVDVQAIGAIVGGVDLVLRGWSAVLRRIDGGSALVGAATLLAGLTALLGYFLWR